VDLHSPGPATPPEPPGIRTVQALDNRIEAILQLINQLLDKAARFVARKSIPLLGQAWLIADLVTGELREDLEEFVDDVRAIKRHIEVGVCGCRLIVVHAVAATPPIWRRRARQHFATLAAAIALSATLFLSTPAQPETTYGLANAPTYAISRRPYSNLLEQRRRREPMQTAAKIMWRVAAAVEIRHRPGVVRRRPAAVFRHLSRWARAA